MTKLSLSALAIALALGTTATLANTKITINANPGEQARMDSDGAFRDGLYLGKLAAESGQPLRLAVGRWSTEQDRAMFTAGYKRGYSESLADVEP
jgi:thiazole synthase ThiGH ThiG subunit